MSIANEKYVSFVSYKRTGEGVATPVWIAPMPNGLAGFTTEPNAGKVKRVLNNSDVTLVPCNVKGKVIPGAQVIKAKAQVLHGAEAKPIAQAIKSKYKILARFFVFADIWRKLRGQENIDCAILISFD